jgi:hypothetical protein
MLGSLFGMNLTTSLMKNKSLIKFTPFFGFLLLLLIKLFASSEFIKSKYFLYISILILIVSSTAYFVKPDSKSKKVRPDRKDIKDLT